MKSCFLSLAFYDLSRCYNLIPEDNWEGLLSLPYPNEDQ